jgi:hypothetical protein
MAVGAVAAVGLGVFAYKKLHKGNPLAALPTFDPINGDTTKAQILAVFFSTPMTDDQIYAQWKEGDSIASNLARFPVTKIVVSPPFDYNDPVAKRASILGPTLDPTPDLAILADGRGNARDAATTKEIDDEKRALRLQP